MNTRRAFRQRGTRAAFGVLVALVIAEPDAMSMPMFARKLGVSCHFCHTTPPRLNEAGYQFRAAGFRLPYMIGKDDKHPFRFFDYSSARVQVTHRATRSQSGSLINNVTELRFQALELYPLTGSWGRHLSSNAKFT